MHETSELYKSIFAGQHSTEIRLAINGTDPEKAVTTSKLISLRTSNKVFSGRSPCIGSCVAGEIDAVMFDPEIEIPKMAIMVPFVRLTDGTRHSEWIRKGLYYIDTRQRQDVGSGLEGLHLHGYDAMLKTERSYPKGSLDWPATDIDVVREIAQVCDIPVDEMTVAEMTQGFRINFPAGYTCREALGYIAAMYAGNFIISDDGKLRLIKLNGLPPETNHLVTENGEPITFGGDRILVR